MKQILLISILFLSTINLQSQPYFFSQSTESFKFLKDSVSINNGNIWSGFQTFNIPIGFTFEFMGNNFSSIDFEATGRLIFDPSHFYYADMFVVSGMQDKGPSSSISPLSYKLTGNSGNQILKIEIKNATYQNDTGSTVNYQIWLYEENSRIELHMGPNNIPNPINAFSLGPFSGVFNVTTFTPLTYIYGLSLYGDPLSPSDSTFTGAGINTFNIKLDNIPPDGTVYRFSNDTVNTGINENENHNRVSVYPNPTTMEINIDLKTNSADRHFIDIYSILGQEIKTIETNKDKIRIDIRDLTKGIYFIVIIDGDNRRRIKKIIKE